jgi:phosphoglycolate phosphatase-like HAD superfamily hydrolase
VVTASEGGVLSAQRAGSRFVVGVLSDVDDASRLRRAGATHLLADIGELPDLLASLAGIPTTGSTTASD